MFIRGKFLLLLIADRWQLLRSLTFVLFFLRDEQFEAYLLVAFVAGGEALPGFERGLVRKTMLRVRDLIDPGLRN